MPGFGRTPVRRDIATGAVVGVASNEAVASALAGKADQRWIDMAWKVSDDPTQVAETAGMLYKGYIEEMGRQLARKDKPDDEGQFDKDFWRWMSGDGTDEEKANTQWAYSTLNPQNRIRLPTIAPEWRKTQEAVFEHEKAMTAMHEFGPAWTTELNDYQRHRLYYKYYVRKGGPGSWKDDYNLAKSFTRDEEPGDLAVTAVEQMNPDVAGQPSPWTIDEYGVEGYNPLPTPGKAGAANLRAQNMHTVHGQRYTAQSGATDPVSVFTTDEQETREYDIADEETAGSRATASTFGLSMYTDPGADAAALQARINALKGNPPIPTAPPAGHPPGHGGYWLADPVTQIPRWVDTGPIPPRPTHPPPPRGPPVPQQPLAKTGPDARRLIQEAVRGGTAVENRIWDRLFPPGNVGQDVTVAGADPAYDPNAGITPAQGGYDPAQVPNVQDQWDQVHAALAVQEWEDALTALDASGQPAGIDQELMTALGAPLDLTKDVSEALTRAERAADPTAPVDAPEWHLMTMGDAGERMVQEAEQAYATVTGHPAPKSQLTRSDSALWRSFGGTVRTAIDEFLAPPVDPPGARTISDRWRQWGEDVTLMKMMPDGPAKTAKERDLKNTEAELKALQAPLLAARQAYEERTQPLLGWMGMTRDQARAAVHDNPWGFIQLMQADHVPDEVLAALGPAGDYVAAEMKRKRIDMARLGKIAESEEQYATRLLTSLPAAQRAAFYEEYSNRTRLPLGELVRRTGIRHERVQRYLRRVGPTSDLAVIKALFGNAPPSEVLPADAYGRVAWKFRYY